MSNDPIYRFYAELKDYEPKILRRFEISGGATMARLGYVLMVLFEMKGYHLFGFDVPVKENFIRCIGKEIDNEINRKTLKMFDKHPEKAQLRVEFIMEDDDFEPRGWTVHAAQTKLKTVLDHEDERMTFEYDYGDGWKADLIVERIYKEKELHAKELPRVLDGQGFGILEDCGGPLALSDIAVLLKKKKGKEYKEFLQWYGYAPDLAAFNIEEMNYRLKKLPAAFRSSYELG